MKGSRIAMPVMALLLAACGDESVREARALPPLPAAPVAAAGFVNKVWRVSQSAQVAPGTLYVFLSDGTLVIASAHGTPSFGKWIQDKDGLRVSEEGLPYHVEVLRLTPDIFRMRSFNPGTPVEMTLVPADLSQQQSAAPAMP